MAEAAGARTRCVWVFWSRARLAPQLLAVFSLTVLDTRQLPVTLQVFSCHIFFGYLPRRELGAVYDPELERELAAKRSLTEQWWGHESPRRQQDLILRSGDLPLTAGLLSIC